MKSIIYLLIAVFAFSIIATSIPNKSIRAKMINIQAVDDNISQADLTASANILTNRLKSFSSEGFDLKVNPEKKQIQVKVPEKCDIILVANLLTNKGKLGFYETYNVQEVSSLLKDDKLIKLLNSSGNVAQLGCMNVKNTGNVVEYLKSLIPVDQCKFVWGQVNSISDVCLYALKTNINGNPLLSGADIDKSSVNTVENEKRNDIQFKFISSAIKPWADVTKRNIGRAIAIEIDNVVISAPIVNTEINQGLCMISGNFTKSEAGFLVSILQNGELPADFKIVK